MKRENKVLKMVWAAMFLAIAYVLPFLTGQIQEIGSMLCPMHIPVLLCGFICGWPWGLAVGFAAPLLRSMLLGMPPFFPKAICMSLELATYGLVAGILYKVLPKKKSSIYVALVIKTAVIVHHEESETGRLFCYDTTTSSPVEITRTSLIVGCHDVRSITCPEEMPVRKRILIFPIADALCSGTFSILGIRTEIAECIF